MLLTRLIIGTRWTISSPLGKKTLRRVNRGPLKVPDGRRSFVTSACTVNVTSLQDVHLKTPERWERSHSLQETITHFIHNILNKHHDRVWDFIKANILLGAKQTWSMDIPKLMRAWPPAVGGCVCNGYENTPGWVHTHTADVRDSTPCLPSRRPCHWISSRPKSCPVITQKCAKFMCQMWRPPYPACWLRNIQKTILNSATCPFFFFFSFSKGLPGKPWRTKTRSTYGSGIWHRALLIREQSQNCINLLQLPYLGYVTELLQLNGVHLI